MRDWSFWKVLGVSIGYMLAALLVVSFLGRAKARAAAEEYERTHAIGPRDSYTVNISSPVWYLGVVIVPPLVLLGLWIVRRVSA